MQERFQIRLIGSSFCCHCSAAWLMLVISLWSLPGCSLFVLAGKVFIGDPKVPAHFTEMTGIDLTKADRKVLIVCSAPEIIKADFPSVKLDLTDGVIRQLHLQGVLVVNPDEVSTWIDNNGGTWDDPVELAEQFDTDYIVHIDLDHFSYLEENTTSFYRGRANGNLFVYSVDRKGGNIETLQIYIKEFTSEFPAHQPVPATEISEKLFYKRYLDRISRHLAQTFYKHKLVDDVF